MVHVKVIISFLFLDITAILYHFDTVIVQKVYEPYNGFNFNYLFITSASLLIFSHICNAFYWAVLLKKNTKVTQP
jgi:hypothetical protein